MMLAFLPGPMAEALAPAAPFGGLTLFLIDGLLALLLYRGVKIFHSEVSKVDALVAEYVRCRDYLLSTRGPTPESGWRTSDGGAFREAWGNFNQHLESVRKRYRAAARGVAVGLWVALALLILAAVLWILVIPGRAGLESWLTAAGAVLTGASLWTTAWVVLRRQRRLMANRTTGNYLLAPWPTDGGAADKQIALLGKFLPVDSLRIDVDPAEVG